MANIKQQKKRILTSEKARQRNQHYRSLMRTRIKSAMTVLEGGEKGDETKATVMAAVSTIDRACAKGVIHRNAAARKKGELEHRLAHL